MKNIKINCNEIDNLESSIKKINLDSYYDEWIVNSKKILTNSLNFNFDETFNNLKHINGTIKNAKSILEEWKLFNEETKPKLDEEYSYELNRYLNNSNQQLIYSLKITKHK